MMRALFCLELAKFECFIRACPNLAAKLKHLETLHREKIDLSLDRFRLLKKMGDPQLRLPPVIHVAGTNGKGSTIAFMRAMLEAAGLLVHAYTSPHLLRFNERIRLAGKLVDDETLLGVLDEIETANDGPMTFFESTTAAALTLFSRVSADVVLLEVGMGGRLDSTNVVTPAVSVITRISYDHTQFLGDTIEQIASEKAGIMKSGVPCVVAYQADIAAKEVFRMRAAELLAPLSEYGQDFSIEELSDGFMYQTQNKNIKFPLPALFGAHQILNAATAITAAKIFLKNMTNENIRIGLQQVEWPGRLQRITGGPIAALLPASFELWYDGAHNDSGAEALAEQCRRWQGQGYDIHLMLGMLITKNAAVFQAVMAECKTVSTIPVPGDMPSHPPADLEAQLAPLTPLRVHAAASIEKAIHHIIPAIKPQKPQLILVCGSLHLAQIFE